MEICKKPEPEKKAGYADMDTVSSWAADAVSWAAENGLICAENGVFSPKAAVTRGMAADTIFHFLKIKQTPYMISVSENTSEALPQAGFTEKITIRINDTGEEAVVSLTDSKPAREFLAQLPMTVTFADFANREKFGRMPVPISEDEALLSGYEIGDFSYGTAYDCMIVFYGQDNEIIDGVIRLGKFDSGLELLSGKENVEVTISAGQR